MNNVNDDLVTNDDTTQTATDQDSGSSNSVSVDDIKKKIKVEEIEPGIFRATTDTSKYIIEYDLNKCIGAASCAVIAPLTFFMNEENRAEILDNGETWDDDDLILSAAQSCPVLAIKIINKETNEQIFPIEDF